MLRLALPRPSAKGRLYNTVLRSRLAAADIPLGRKRRVGPRSPLLN